MVASVCCVSATAARGACDVVFLAGNNEYEAGEADDEDENETEEEEETEEDAEDDEEEERGDDNNDEGDEEDEERGGEEDAADDEVMGIEGKEGRGPVAPHSTTPDFDGLMTRRPVPIHTHTQI